MWRLQEVTGVSGAKRWPFSVDTADLQVSKQGAEEERHNDITADGLHPRRRWTDVGKTKERK